MWTKTLFVLVAVALASCGGGAESPTTRADTTTSSAPVPSTQAPTTITTPPTTTTTTTTTIPSAGLVWEQVPYTAQLFGGEQWTTYYEQWVTDDSALFDVTAGGPGLVAVGYRSFAGPTEAAIWVSPDGRAWSALDHEFGSGTAMFAVTKTRDLGLVAVGWGGAVDDPDAQVWISADGLNWQQIVAASLGGESGQLMWDVAATESALVAVGSSGPPDDLDPAVWVSTDGLDWRRIADSSLADGTMFGVCGGGPGLVAVGTAGSGEAVGGAVWTSVDGMAWQRVPDDDGVFGSSYLRAVENTAAGLIAVGHRSVGDGRVGSIWLSEDGVDWTLVAGEGPGFADASIRAVAGIGPRLIAVGYDSTGDAPESAIWTSIDGVTWERVAAPDATPLAESRELRSVTVGDSGFVAVGIDILRVSSAGRTTQSSFGAIWVSSPS